VFVQIPSTLTLQCHFCHLESLPFSLSLSGIALLCCFQTSLLYRMRFPLWQENEGWALWLSLRPGHCRLPALWKTGLYCAILTPHGHGRHAGGCRYPLWLRQQVQCTLGIVSATVWPLAGLSPISCLSHGHITHLFSLVFIVSFSILFLRSSQGFIRKPSTRHNLQGM
jgi:hypothetical protein